MFMKRNRLFYGVLIILTIALGLFSRKIAYPYLPGFINEYLGDAIWSAMIFLIFRFILFREDTRLVAICSLIFCFLIEISQIYHAPWIDLIRETTLGGLVLGSGFLWTDLLAYYIGIHFAATFELYLLKRKQYNLALS
jgi:hypothetical protein